MDPDPNFSPFLLSRNRDAQWGLPLQDLEELYIYKQMNTKSMHSNKDTGVKIFKNQKSFQPALEGIYYK